MNHSLRRIQDFQIHLPLRLATIQLHTLDSNLTHVLPSSSSQTVLPPPSAPKISPPSNHTTIGPYPNSGSAPTYAQPSVSQPVPQSRQPQSATLTEKTPAATFNREIHPMAEPRSIKAIDSLFNSSTASNPSKENSPTRPFGHRGGARHAQEPYRLGWERRLLTRRQARGLGLWRQDRAALGGEIITSSPPTSIIIKPCYILFNKFFSDRGLMGGI